ncbi:MAG TPA: DUF1800 domain-containing protein [Methylomirabilota bacterium]|nr:DUF1800 domain-containing protein [Methylomirabilota bacterium]
MLRPLPDSKWNFTTAAHLLNRAGFGGPPAAIERLVKLGLDGAVDWLVDYEKVSDPTKPPEWARPDPTRFEMAQANRRIRQEVGKAGGEELEAFERKRRERARMERQEQNRQMIELRGWWLKRMAEGPRPLQEKLTLFWHGHFATSAQKVRDPYYMWLQNETFRSRVSGGWFDLLSAVTRDPAMLLWLDQAQSHRRRPNENYAREVMELFSLGEGNYTEQDVGEVARAFTGLTLDRRNQRFVYRPAMHDPGVKTVLGQTGNLDADAVLERILAHPSAAPFICGRLWRFFASENPPEGVVDALAGVLRKHDLQFKPVLGTLFRSEEFYRDDVMRQQIKSPVQWLVGGVRMLERDLPAAPVAAALLASMGQNLFAPPNVKGWDGGLSWITTNNLLARYNYTAVLVFGDLSVLRAAGGPMMGMRSQGASRRARDAGASVERILNDSDRARVDTLIAALERRLLQSGLKEKQRQSLAGFLESRSGLSDDDLLHAIRLVMSTPEYQLT